MLFGPVILVFIAGAFATAPPLHPVPGGVTAYLLGLLLLTLVPAMVVSRLTSRLLRTGRASSFVLAERVVSAARWLIVAYHVAAIMVAGWIRVDPERTPEARLAIELLVAAAPLTAFTALYWAFAPMHQRLREAILWRHLHEGRLVLVSMTRWELVVDHIRHALLLAALPIATLSAWSALGERIGPWWAGHDLNPRGLGVWVLGWHVAGLLLVVSIVPMLMRRLWSTVRLGEGDLRREIERVLERAGVGVREILVWRSALGIVNAAVLGATRPARYLLFSEMLLSVMTRDQVRAVAAHEAGHGRYNHLVWLLATGLLSALALALLGAVFLSAGGRSQAEASSLVLSLGALLGSMVVVGWVSRRFEHQADAYAAKDLSSFVSTAPEAAPEAVAEAAPVQTSCAVTAEGVAPVRACLQVVAEYNGLEIDRFTWRHGSIAARLSHLSSLIGRACDDLPIDRTVRRIKFTVAVGWCALAILGWWAWG